MRAAEKERRENELESIENFYRDKFDMLAEGMKAQQAEIRCAEQENVRIRNRAKTDLIKRLERELKEMQERL